MVDVDKVGGLVALMDVEATPARQRRPIDPEAQLRCYREPNARATLRALKLAGLRASGGGVEIERRQRVDFPRLPPFSFFEKIPELEL